MDDWDRLRYNVSDPAATLRANADSLRARLEDCSGNDYGEVDALAAALAAIEHALQHLPPDQIF